MVIDADGLYIVTKNLDLIKGCKNAILTPNKNEYQRLADQLNIDLEDPSTSDEARQRANQTNQLVQKVMSLPHAMTQCHLYHLLPS